MTLNALVKKLDLTVCCCSNKLNSEVTGGYASDLLSDVIASSKAGNIWVTMQAHPNIVAVAVLKELSAIILVKGRQPTEETIVKANAEQVVILASKCSTFEIVGKLYALGIGNSTNAKME